MPSSSAPTCPPSRTTSKRGRSTRDGSTGPHGAAQQRAPEVWRERCAGSIPAGRTQRPGAIRQPHETVGQVCRTGRGGAKAPHPLTHGTAEHARTRARRAPPASRARSGCRRGAGRRSACRSSAVARRELNGASRTRRVTGAATLLEPAADTGTDPSGRTLGRWHSARGRSSASTSCLAHRRSPRVRRASPRARRPQRRGALVDRQLEPGERMILLRQEAE
jgi:hypothetical protein